MTENRNQADYLQKATMYDLLAQFYKYTNPNLHIHFYLKHYKNISKAMNIMRTTSPSLQGEAKIRLLHTSQDSPAVDVYINGNRIFRDLSFNQVSTSFPLKAGKYHIDVYPAGNMVDSILNKIITVETRRSYTLATINPMKKMRLLVFLNDVEVPANEAKVRFIHLSADAPPLDIAVKDRDVIFPKVSYKQATDYLGLTPMTVDLEARLAGSKELLLPMPKAQFRSNESYTIVFLRLADSPKDLQCIILRD